MDKWSNRERRNAAELARLAALYCWDMDAGQAENHPDRVILRAMDLGTWDDLLALQNSVDGDRLTYVLRRAPAGALRPRSWSFWHYRLGLVAPGGQLPPQPPRRIE